MNITKKILVLTLLQGLLPGLLCQRWEFPSKIVGVIGSCVEIPCTFYPPRNSRISSPVWYLYHRSGYPQIFNSQENSEVLMAYRGRTSLVPGSPSCSLRIDPVRRDDGGDYYYPGIAEDPGTNAYSLHSMYLRLGVTGTPSKPALKGSNIMFEGRLEVVTCSVEHTCGSSPPSLKWNKAGQTERQSEDLSGGYWREISRLTYIPSHEDDKTQIQCTATYHRGATSHSAATLDIRYSPKDVTVSLPKDVAFAEGSDVILTCNSRSNPPPLRYEWYHTNSTIKLETQLQKMKVLNVNRETEPFSCAAINDVGRGESPPTEIPVQYAATGVQVIVLHPTEGATELKCSFLSSNPNVTHYTWIKDGITLVDKSGLILVLDSNEDESGSYSCIAHNTAGSSNSTKLDFPDREADDEDSSNLPLILGVLAGVIVLLFLVIIVYFYTRRKRKTTSESSAIHGEIRSHFPNISDQDETLVQEHEYGNIQVKPKPLPRSQQSQFSSHASGEKSDAIYSNAEFIQAEEDIEYSTIAHSNHGRSGRRQDLFDGDYGDDVNYAAVKN